MAVGMSLQLARMKADAGSAEVPELIDEAIAELAAATAELRELARGIHPAVLTDLGLGAAVKVLAARSPIPVKLAVASAGRLPARRRGRRLLRDRRGDHQHQPLRARPPSPR